MRPPFRLARAWPQVGVAALIAIMAEAACASEATDTGDAAPVAAAVSASVLADADVDPDARFSFDIHGHESAPGKAVRLLRQASAAFILDPLDSPHLQAWQQTLTMALRKGGYPIAQVIVTQENADRASTTGRLQFSAYLGELGKLTLTNTSLVDDALLRSRIGTALCATEYGIGQGCVLESQRLERATQLLQDMPGVSLSGAPALSADDVGIGETHLSVATAANGQPYSVGVIADNQGSQATGTMRLGLSGSATNVFGAGDNYLVSLYKTNKDMWSGSAGASAPLGDDGWRWALNAGRSYYTVNQGILINGVADSLSAGLTYPVVRGLDANVNTALDLVSTRTHVSYPDYGLEVHSRLSSLRGTLSGNNGDRAQQLGENISMGSLSLTLGTQGNDDALDVAPHRKGHYMKLAATALRRQMLSDQGDLFAIINLRGQATNKNIDASEMLALGGVGGVRAFRADEGSVSQGVIASVDAKWRLPTSWGDQLVPGIFVDAAYGQVNRKPWAGWESGYPNISDVKNHRSLSAAGLSLDYVTTSGITTSVSWARRLSFSGDSWIKPGSAQSRFWVTVSWKM